MSDEAPRPPGADPAPGAARKREIPWGLILGAIALAGAAAPFALPRLRRALSHRPPSGRTAPMLISGRCPAGMAEIPGATAQLGSTHGGVEQPPHSVTLAPYCIDGSEVTVSAYAACVRSGRCTPAATDVGGPGTTPWDKQHGGQFCNADRPDRQEHPVNCLEWSQAEAYCKAMGGRLPTEEEWEYAARGSDGRPYPWGEDDPSPVLLDACGSECVDLWERSGKTRGPLYDADDGWEATAPVGSYPAGKSPFGLVDMVGNVWEWTASAPGAGDPQPPNGGEARVLRGGSWSINSKQAVMTTSRGFHQPTSRSNGIGFRCARDLP
jgi:formylglycine-generating enzyme required for sulfatase activity